MAAILCLNIRSSTHIIKCRVCFPMVSPILFGRTTPGATILVQHSPLGTGWGPHEDMRHVSTTKWYHTTSMVTREFFPASLSHKMLNHAKLGENVNKISKTFSNWDVFLKQYALCMSKVRVPLWWDVTPAPSGWRRLAGPGQRSAVSDGLRSFLHHITTGCHVCWYNIYNIKWTKSTE